MSHATRRSFLKNASVGSLIGASNLSVLPMLQSIRADEASVSPDVVQLQPEIEPLVRLLEDTPRDELIEKVAARVRDGLSYRQVLAALLLAGVRNVQPRPSVGFKFHAVLVVNSCHLASMSSPDNDRWLPFFWGLDYFKSSQARDVREGNWTMGPVDESAVPSSTKAVGAFKTAMDNWDEAAVDAAVAGLVRTGSANQMFELFARYGVRDFRSIGHKAIFVANSWRTLNCIGWRHAEPVLRSLAYALLNHNNEPNPATSDLAPDRAWRRNDELSKSIRTDWLNGKIDSNATQDLLVSLRNESSDQVCDQVCEIINAGVSPQSVYDALFVGAGELLMRQPGIVSLHALTTTNAMRFAYQTVADDSTRRMILLQNAAFLPLFREAMAGRGDVRNAKIDELSELKMESGSDGIQQIFRQISNNRDEAASLVLGHLENGGSPGDVIGEARRQVFLRGTDSHDYKFSSAVLEDFYNISPNWRNRFLASSVYKLRGSAERNNGLINRVRSAFS